MQLHILNLDNSVGTIKSWASTGRPSKRDTINFQGGTINFKRFEEAIEEATEEIPLNCMNR